MTAVGQRPTALTLEHRSGDTGWAVTFTYAGATPIAPIAELTDAYGVPVAGVALDTDTVGQVVTLTISGTVPIGRYRWRLSDSGLTHLAGEFFSTDQPRPDPSPTSIVVQVDTGATVTVAVAAAFSGGGGGGGSMTAADILAAIKTVDGTGTGLDADLLDGHQAGAFVYWAATVAEADAFPPGSVVLVLDPAGPSDSTPPSTPTNLVGVGGDTIADLSWTASTDNVAVSGYRIYRNATLIDTIGALTTYQATGLTNGVSYQFTVSAVDTSNNESAQSAAVTVTPDSGAFTPTDISNLVAWFDADNAGVADGAAMATWLDQSGNARHLLQATGAAQPVYAAAGINGHPAVYFNGSKSMATAAFTAVPYPHTLFVVHKLEALGTLRYSVDGVAAGGRLGLFRNAGGTAPLGFTGGVAMSGTVASTTAAELVTVVHNGATSTLQKNNEPVDTADAGTHSFTGINVGSRYGGTISPWLGHVGAVLVYSRVLTAPEIAQVKLYLNSKFTVY